MATDTKQRMVEAASGLLRTRGQAQTSFTDVLAASGAARGAIYHHFPGGKAELVREAVVWTGRSVRARLAEIDGDDPARVVDSFLAAVRPAVRQSAGGTSCAIAAVTLEQAQIDPDLTEVTRQALESWVEVLRQRLEQAGATACAAGALSTLMVAFLEGSHVLCRAAGSIEPFDRSAVGVTAAARALLAET